MITITELFTTIMASRAEQLAKAHDPLYEQGGAAVMERRPYTIAHDEGSPWNMGDGGRAPRTVIHVLGRKVLDTRPEEGAPPLYINGEWVDALCATSPHPYPSSLPRTPLDFATARMRRASILLASGLYAPGWEEHEAVYRSSEWAKSVGFSQTSRDLSGLEPLRPGRIPREGCLVHAVGSMEDTFGFVGFVPSLEERFNTLVVEVQKPLVALVRRSLPSDVRVIARGDALEDVNLTHEVPMLSLPYVLGLDSRNAIAQAPKVPLVADAEKVTAWSAWLHSVCGDKTPVGVCWRSDPNNKFDQERDLQSPAQLRPLQNDGTVLISLLDDATPAEKAALPGLVMPKPDGERVSFDDMAALIIAIGQKGGHVAAIDTAFPNLAGALGVPTTLLLNTNPNWRWGYEGDTTPWFNSVALLRQPEPGNWAPVIEEAARRQHRSGYNVSRPGLT